MVQKEDEYMRTKTINNAKIIVTIKSNKHTKRIETVSAFDNRTKEDLSEEYIKERGINFFLNLDDLKETLNWNLNGDGKKFQFKWGQSGKTYTEGRAYIFD